MRRRTGLRSRCRGPATARPCPSPHSLWLPGRFPRSVLWVDWRIDKRVQECNPTIPYPSLQGLIGLRRLEPWLVVHPSQQVAVVVTNPTLECCCIPHYLLRVRVSRERCEPDRRSSIYRDQAVGACQGDQPRGGGGSKATNFHDRLHRRTRILRKGIVVDICRQHAVDLHTNLRSGTPDFGHEIGIETRRTRPA